jgi:hypothetical protein
MQYRQCREALTVRCYSGYEWLGSAATCSDNSALHLGTSNLQNQRHYTNRWEIQAKPKTQMKAETVVTKTAVTKPVVT